jgi:hypothetical protein
MNGERFLEQSDDELLHQSGGDRLSQSEDEESDSPVRKCDGHDLAKIVTRRCRCDHGSGDCFQQFQGREQDIEAARAEFRALTPAMQDVQISILFCGGQRGAHALTLGSIRSSVASTACESDVGIALEQSDSDAGGILGQSDNDAEGEETQRGKRPYATRCGSRTKSGMIAGTTVCKHALQSLLGIGSKTLTNVRKGSQRVSRQEPKHPQLGFSLVQKSWTLTNY